MQLKTKPEDIMKKVVKNNEDIILAFPTKTLDIRHHTQLKILECHSENKQTRNTKKNYQKHSEVAAREKYFFTGKRPAISFSLRNNILDTISCKKY